MQGVTHKMHRVIDEDGAIHHWSCKHCGLPGWFPEKIARLEKRSCSRTAVDTQLHGLKLALKETRQHLSLSIKFMGLIGAVAIAAAILRDFI